MGDLDVAGVEVVVGEDGAADGGDDDGAVLEVGVGEGLGDELVDDAVAAAGAVVGGAGRGGGSLAWEFGVDALGSDDFLLHGFHPPSAVGGLVDALEDLGERDEVASEA